MKNPWIFPAATLLVGAVGGYISGKNTSPSGSSPAVENSSSKTRSSSRPEAAGESSSKRANRPTSTEQITRLPGASNRIQSLMEFYAGLTPSQLEDEARKLESLPMNERIMASFLLFGRWAETDPTAAMNFSNTMGMAGGFVRPTILQSWASVDPANAAKYYSDNPREFAMMGMFGGGRGPMGGQGGASIIASEWAKSDPTAALNWANSLTADKSQALSAVVGEVAKTDPKKAAGMLAGLSGDDLGRAYSTIASQYGASNFTEAQAWIKSLPADDQARALAAAIGGLSNTDPEAASRQIASIAEGDERDRAVSDIVEDWARVNPQAAADFLKTQDSERAQRDGLRQLMPAWVSQNPTAALSYAKSLPEGSARDSALGSYVWSNSKASPADLMKVAETISDEGDRNRTIGMTAMRWMREDETAAKAYIEQSTVLSDEEKQRLSEGRGMWGGPGGGGRGRGGRGGGNGN